MNLPATWRALEIRGVMGMNRRNALYIGPLNARRAYPLVDNKRITRDLAARHRIPMPELFGVIDAHGRLGDLRGMVADRPEFVVKPARGAGGNGIVLIAGHDTTCLTKASGEILTWEEITYHTSSILSGIYSLEGLEDQALIESFIRMDPVFKAVSYRGVPDVRIVVYKGVPVMAMVRLPTRQSDGKANLHQGAIGAGISLRAGITKTAVQGRRIVDRHPDTGQPVSGIEVPFWQRILEIAAFGYEMTGLGYLGADLVMDQARGPVLLELNARPGLAIQLANQEGLQGRLRRLDEAWEPGRGVEDRVALARSLFA